MLDADTFLTELYVMVDDFCKASLPAETRPGPEASLSRSEVVTLAIFGPWGRFSSERDFWRFAQARLLSLIPRRDKIQLPKWWHKRLVSLRQMVESVYEKLRHAFRLHRERPHALGGFAARLAAKVGLHHFCIWLNRSLGRPPLQFADLLDW